MLTDYVDLLRTIIAFTIVLGVLVFIHEFGHYLAARWYQVRVLTFSIGFGRPLVQWTDSSGTNWKIACVPLGGYVRLRMFDDAAELAGRRRDARHHGKSFQEVAAGARAAIVAAGPAANFALAIVLFAAIFTAIGMPMVVPVVDEVIRGSAADKAGVLVNDKIRAVNDIAIHSFDKLRHLVLTTSHDSLSIVVERRGEFQLLNVAVPTRSEEHGTTRHLGVRGGQNEYYSVGPLGAMLAGVTKTYAVATETLLSMTQMVTAGKIVDEFGGPLRIAQLSGHAVSLGLDSVLLFISVLSINLGIVNLLPIPLLDGGHLLLHAVEALRGRALPEHVKEYGFRVGIVVVVTLFAIATWNDLVQIGIVSWIVRSVS